MQFMVIFCLLVQYKTLSDIFFRQKNHCSSQISVVCAPCSLHNADIKHYRKNLAFSNLVTPNELTMNPRLNQSIFIIQNGHSLHPVLQCTRCVTIVTHVQKQTWVTIGVAPVHWSIGHKPHPFRIGQVFLLAYDFVDSFNDQYSIIPKNNFTVHYHPVPLFVPTIHQINQSLSTLNAVHVKKYILMFIWGLNCLGLIRLMIHASL